MSYFNIYGQLVAEDTELYHHGIKGQKWGERNGPPYPLDSADKSPSEKREGSGGASSSAGDTQTSRRKGLTKGQKRALAITAGVVATGAAAYGAHKVLSNLSDDDIQVLRETAKKALNGKTAASDKRKLSKKEQKEKIIKAIKELDDSELTKRVERLKKENDLSKLMGEGEINSTSIDRGRKIFDKYLNSLDDKIIVPLSIGFTVVGLKTLMGLTYRTEEDVLRDAFKTVNEKKK